MGKQFQEWLMLDYVIRQKTFLPCGWKLTWFWIRSWTGTRPTRSQDSDNLLQFLSRIPQVLRHWWDLLLFSPGCEIPELKSQSLTENLRLNASFSSVFRTKFEL